jgi:voltage-gated potassium channel
MRALRDLERWTRTPMHVLSFAWLMLVFGQMLRPRAQLLALFGTAIWAIFLVEFSVRLALAPAKLRFLKSNLLTLVSLAVPAFRLAGLLRALRLLSVLGGGQVLILIGAVNRSMNALRVSLGRRKVAFVATLTIIVMLLGAAGMQRFEPHAAISAAGGFTGYGDALWWTAMLMTTIGSAYWPITPAGRVLGFLLSVYSIGVFGYVTAALASLFVGQDAQDSRGPVAGADDIERLRREIAALRVDLDPARRAQPSASDRDSFAAEPKTPLAISDVSASRRR